MNFARNQMGGRAGELVGSGRQVGRRADRVGEQAGGLVAGWRQAVMSRERWKEMPRYL